VLNPISNTITKTTLASLEKEDEDIKTINKLSLLTAGARYQLLTVNQQLMKYKISHVSK
jgi:hypothetical protein